MAEKSIMTNFKIQLKRHYVS